MSVPATRNIVILNTFRAAPSTSAPVSEANWNMGYALIVIVTASALSWSAVAALAGRFL